MSSYWGTLHFSDVNHPVGYRGLAQAIVLQAVLEYRIAHYVGSEKGMAEVEAFFRSSWFEVLCDINPEYLIRKLKAEPPRLPTIERRR